MKIGEGPMRKKNNSMFFSMIFLLALVLPGARYYVTTGGSSSSDGLNWQQAKQTIIQAVSEVAEGDEIWVAAGTYQESDTVTVPENVALYGGFSGTETVLTQRVIRSNPTIIDGVDSHQCVYNYGTVDGFHLTNGNTSQGGGMYNNSGIVINCRIYGNTASYSVGGIFNNCGTVVNTLVHHNTSENSWGGIYNYEGTVTACVSYCNAGKDMYGDGIYNSAGTVSNCIMWNNYFGDFSNYRGTIQNCCYSEASGDNGCFSGNPLFVNTSGDASSCDFHLQDGSPCVDMGTLENASATDIDGTLRPGGDNKVCMGAYESPDAYLPGIPAQRVEKRFYVSPAGDNTTGVSWSTAFNNPNSAVEESLNYDGYCEVWVAAGTYSGTVGVPSKVALYAGFSGTEYTLTERNVELNIAAIEGGSKPGMLNAGTVDGFHIRNSTGDSYNGCGVMNYDGTVANCRVYNNKRNSGIYNIRGSVTNCIVFDNNADSLGAGGITSISDGSSVVNCTVNENDSGGIYMQGTGFVTNCIVWNNSGYDILCDVGTSGTVLHSCYQIGKNVVGSNNIQLDPFFKNAAQGDFHLNTDSPCIDSGTDSGAPLADCSGLSRPWGNGYDMGAYECNEEDTEVSNTIFSLYQ